MAVPAVLVAAALAAGGASEASAATFTVTTDAGAGAGSLREQILAANAAANVGGPDVIEFAIPGAGRHQIRPAGLDLPTITDPVVIDGFTEAGSAPPTVTTPAELRIAIDADNLTRGLRVETDDSTVRGLAVHSAGVAGGLAAAGIEIRGDGNRVEGSFVGLKANGMAAGNTTTGVQVVGDENVVGGTGPEDRNVLSANGVSGASLLGDDNRVKGNVIGADPEVLLALGNANGVHVMGEGNVVGGGSDGAANVISANDTGVVVADGAANEVSGNLVGTDATGTDELGGLVPGDVGVHVLEPASATQVGRPDAGNVIVGQGDTGVELDGDDNVVQANHVGVDVTGEVDLGNTDGIEISGDDNRVGGTGAGEGNVVSGNTSDGIETRADDAAANDQADRNVIKGNLIGTDADGETAIGNADGIEVMDADDTKIGGTQAGAGNVVSGNRGTGISVFTRDTQSSDRTEVVANLIGTNLAGADLGNVGDGVSIDEAARTRVGVADVAVAPNTIAFNGGDGIVVEDGQANAAVRNAIFENGDLGIDLDDDGVTPNDPPAALDGDAGPNGLQNHPVITAVAGGVVDWELHSAANTPYRVELYANDACDPSGSGEGQTFLASVNVVTNGAGEASGSTAVAAAAGQSVAATASVRNGAVVDASSEFSPCVTVP